MHHLTCTSFVFFLCVYLALGHLVLDFLHPPLLLMNGTMPAAASTQCWREESSEGRKGKRRVRGDRRGTREGEGGEEKRVRGASRCSSLAVGRGWATKNPGCSAKTSMGGCVGSHHDSSGSLNENSDGTGGNLTGSSAAFGGWEGVYLSGLPLGFLGMLSFLAGGPGSPLL